MNTTPKKPKTEQGCSRRQQKEKQTFSNSNSTRNINYATEPLNSWMCSLYIVRGAARRGVLGCLGFRILGTASGFFISGTWISYSSLKVASGFLDYCILDCNR